MIKIYRLEKDGVTTHEEVCHACAKKKKEEGYEPIYDLALSERVPVSKVIDRECDLCHGFFFLDGRKRWEKIHDVFSLCF